LEVGILGIGTAPFGRPDMSQAEVNRVVDAAIDAGINYLDTAPIYGLSERRLGEALQGKRDKFILVTKVEATSLNDASWMVRESLMKLKTDYLDVVHLHNVGRTDRFPSLDVLLASDGALEALRRLKKKGVIRHIGLTNHMRPKRALPVMDTGDIEVVMCAANFVDRHTYNFEETVFAEAGKRGMGVVAMKILGGRTDAGAKLSGEEHYKDAVRYALSIPGLSVAIMGMKSVAELEKGLAIATSHEPFSDEELSRLEKKGKAMAAEWGELRGPVEWA
ncbi:MAG: aldo/keto reductase, partial [bacterium]|nr:aldo/keto reductase [bacterium]